MAWKTYHNCDNCGCVVHAPEDGPAGDAVEPEETAIRAVIALKNAPNGRITRDDSVTHIEVPETVAEQVREQTRSRGPNRMPRLEVCMGCLAALLGDELVEIRVRGEEGVHT